ncbi:DUF6544 family protein [Caulobacter sp. DWR1-3-2b1]|uniref:DUF6544 family protein n=1 Tax=Caulobacter sp. DWR1-3-2b1 TaxID=2804670 RepID=UPI003CEFC069
MTDRFRARLPSAVVDLALRLGADPIATRSRVRLGQSGQMRQDATKAWMPFTARQTLATDRCDFDWRARSGPAGLIFVRDAIDGGRGRFAVLALGILQIVNVKPSAELTRGQLMRYLAELAWTPDAILHNTALRWREDGPDRLVVGAGSDQGAAEVTLGLDSDGRIDSAFAPDRGRMVGKTIVPTPWGGRFLDYRHHHGVWLPFGAEVSWSMPEGEVVYWKARIDFWRRG